MRGDCAFGTVRVPLLGLVISYVGHFLLQNFAARWILKSYTEGPHSSVSQDSYWRLQARRCFISSSYKSSSRGIHACTDC
jgi:hypothetical protein